MKLLTPAQMQEVDKRAVSCYQIPSVLLMEHAALKLYEYLILEEIEEILILCGPGNNGGDGLALARLVKSLSAKKVEVILVANPHQLSEDGRTYYVICKALGVSITQMDEDNKELILEKIRNTKFIVDALFGTGIKRPIEGSYKKVIEAANDSNAQIVSVDIPSGIDGYTGKVQGVAIKADVTITFMAPKIGLFLYPGIVHAGQVKVVDIGIPKQLIQEVESDIDTIETKDMKQLLPHRPVRSNKGTFGKVLVIGGQLGMSGAICLTSLAAYKVGCGTVTTMVPRCIMEIIGQKLTEAMTIGMADEAGHFHKQASKDLPQILEGYDVVAIGPGMGRTKETLFMLEAVLKSNKPCVIDADALFFVAQLKDLIRSRTAPTIMTPHPGEMARILNKTIQQILEDPLSILEEFVNTFHAYGILKIEKTVIADRDKHIYINRYGNSGLAKGGSGDTLTGIITGVLAQHMLPIEAMQLGVYLQTKAADLAKEALSEYSYLASDTIHYLGKVFLELMAE